MQRILQHLLTLISTGCMLSLASAQGFNVDFSNNGVVLPSSYAAAGTAGFWNTVAPPFLGSVPLLDLSGNPGSVTLLHQGASPSISNFVDPLFTGNEATLMLDGFATTDIPVIMRFQGLQPATYEVTLYGIVPGNAAMKTKFLQIGSNPLVGGAYPGSFVLGVTHAVEQKAVGTSGELRFDWVSGAGGLGLCSGVQIRKLCDSSATTYCSALTSSSGCVPGMGSSGSASLSNPSAFAVVGSNLEVGSNGLMFFGTTGQDSTPFFGGTLCVKVPLYRLAVLNSGGASACTGSIAYTLSDLLAQPNGGPLIVAGAVVDCQIWFRDPPATQTVGLTNGIEFSVCP